MQDWERVIQERVKQQHFLKKSAENHINEIRKRKIEVEDLDLSGDPEIGGIGLMLIEQTFVVS